MSCSSCQLFSAHHVVESPRADRAEVRTNSVLGEQPHPYVRALYTYWEVHTRSTAARHRRFLVLAEEANHPEKQINRGQDFPDFAFGRSPAAL